MKIDRRKIPEHSRDKIIYYGRSKKDSKQTL